MTEKRYKVLIDNQVVAQDMNIETAIILVKALFEKYYNDFAMTVSVREMERTEVVYDR